MTHSIPLRSVPFFEYPHVFALEEEDFVTIVRSVGGRGAFIAQKDLADFERNLADFLGAKYAVGVGNATDGLHLSLRGAEIGVGSEVILSSHTMVATAGAIYFAGAIPIPVECGSDHLIDPAGIAAAVTPRTKAIMPTQLNGRTCDMDKLQAIADKHSLLIVEDAAQALGSKYKSKCAGTFGVASAISFYPAKVLGCLGDGGAVITNDDKMYERLLQLRDHGRNQNGEIVSWGLNSRLDNIQAAILDFKLQRYDQVIERRRQIARHYTDRLKDLPELVLPPAPDSDADHFDIFQNYEIEADRRDELREWLKERGIGTLIQWNGRAIHHLKALGFTQSLPYTDYLFTRMLMLPMNMSMTNDDGEYVCEMLRQFYRH
jgi:dTDP-4-amino-4,6-dideoxygalactose transaminase